MIKRPHKKGWRCVAPLPQLDPGVPFVILPDNDHEHKDSDEDDGDGDDDEYDAGNDANVNDISIAVAAYRHKW